MRGGMPSSGVTDKFATIYCLLYGDHLKLQQRLLLSLKKYAPKNQVDIVIWCNELTSACCQQVERLFPPELAKVIFSSDNMPKYRAMWHMFHDPAYGVQPKTPWIIWFDDDSHIVATDWWRKTRRFIERKKKEDICYVGQPWYVHYLEGQWDFVKQSTWFKRLPPKNYPTRGRRKQPGVRFAQGAYWWLRTKTMKSLNWPDPRLNHNGGDTLLGEAIRQRGLPFHEFSYGVKINDGKRRGFRESPAGAKNKRARR